MYGFNFDKKAPDEFGDELIYQAARAGLVDDIDPNDSEENIRNKIREAREARK